MAEVVADRLFHRGVKLGKARSPAGRQHEIVAAGQDAQTARKPARSTRSTRLLSSSHVCQVSLGRRLGLPAPHLQTRCLMTSYFGVARPVATAIGHRRSGRRRYADHDRRSLRKLAQDRVDQGGRPVGHNILRAASDRPEPQWNRNLAAKTAAHLGGPRLACDMPRKNGWSAPRGAGGPDGGERPSISLPS